MPTNPNDVVYRAEVDDQTSKFFDRFDARLTQQEQRTQQQFRQVENNMNKVGAVAGLVGGAVGVIAGKAIDAVFNMVGGINNFMKSSVMAAARADTLGTALKIIGNNAGYSDDQLADFEKGLRKTGISITSARDSLAKMVQSELDLTEATKLARVAQDAAVIAGEDSSATFQRILHGITTLQPEILRMVGITVNMEQEVRKYAAANNKAATSISYAEKKQIALNAVMEAGKKIAGAYEAAMDTVGKKLGSLQGRILPDLMVQIGAVFQKAFGVAIDFAIEEIKELTEWFENNQDKVEEWAERLGVVMEIVVGRIKDLIELIKSIPPHVENAGIALTKLLSQLPDEEIESRRSKLGEYFRQAITLLVTFTVAGFKLITEAASIAAEGTRAIFTFNPAQAAERIEQVRQRIEEFDETFMKTFNDTFWAIGTFTGAIDEAGDAAEETADDIDKTSDAAAKLDEALTQANNSLRDFYMEMQRDVEANAIKEAREAIEAALKESWYREDQARKWADAVSKIMEGAEKSQIQAAENYAKARLDIERNYQRQLRDIKQGFEFEAEELARARDAIGLLRLKRNTDFQLKQAKQNRDDQLADAKRSFEEQKVLIDQQRQEQLDALEEQFRREEEERQRSIERDQELQRLHDQWEEEDRQRKYAEQLADLLKQFGSLEGITEDGLGGLLEKWRTYFGTLIDEAKAYQQQITDIMGTLPTYNPADTSGATAGGSYGYWGPYIRPPSTSPGGGKITPQSVGGQGGQISTLLANPSMVLSPSGGSVAPLPFVSPGPSRQVKEIRVQVSGETLDPYMQRLLVNALLEVERNR